MNLSFINKLTIIFLCFSILVSCSTKNLYEKIKVKKYEPPLIENYNNENIFLYQSVINKINFENKYTLKKFRYKNTNSFNGIIIDSNLYIINDKLNLLVYDIITRELVASIKLEIIFNDDETLSSFQ